MQTLKAASKMPLQEIIAATNNSGKIREIQKILENFDCRIIPIGQIISDFTVEEDGATYAENALKKGREAVKKTGRIAIADDSGLEVDALDGAPGIYSARFGGEQLAQPQKNALLLEKLQGITHRAARFRCVIAVVTTDGREETVEGVCEGSIGYEARGTHGFGFDPIFFVPEYQKTMAELAPDVKNRISHRAKAVQQLPKLFRHFL